MRPTERNHSPPGWTGGQERHLFMRFRIVGVISPFHSLRVNWICAFLWFSRRCAFFSAPVVGVTAVVIASYGAIALLVALLTGGNWRNGLLVFVVAPFSVAGVVLRLHLLQ
jgi:hypothetical protein